MTAVAPFDWIPILVAAGTLALGSVLTMLGQGLADRRVRKREMLARRDQLQIQLYQEEREVLFGLQQVCLDLHTKYVRVQAAAMDCDESEITEVIFPMVEGEMDDLNKQVVLLHQCRSDAVRGAILAYAGAMKRWKESATRTDAQQAWEDLTKVFGAIHGALGTELRRNPLDEIGLSTWRFRRRRGKKATPKDRSAQLDSGAVDNG
ncbi:hypothetical protein [Nonomuraea basaltis]|uniref:hypothetical protein n=1 Tax=Nonomuraea basaltis TaxID=2495887 RepID=UPI00110C4B7E|nr:hypothetical protein [Nonomuraea basaltis]TMR99532.1 hypothetical protein EJK15_06885 [Nonomuraea basaltis]